MDIRRTTRHGSTAVLRAAFCNDTIEFVEIGIEVKDLSTSMELYHRDVR